MHLGKRIAFIHHSANSESSLDLAAGVEIAGELLGCEVLVFDPDFDQRRRRECVAAALDADPDLVVAAVVTPSLLGDLFDRVAERGIPWIEVGARQKPARGLTAQVVPDEDALTALLDRWLIDALARRHGPEATASIAAWTATGLGEGLLARDLRRARDLRANPRVREVYTHDISLTDLADDVRSSTIAALRRHPDIRGLWQTCEPCVSTQAAALDELGLDGEARPLLAGFYSNQETRRLVADGRVDALVQVDTRVQGLVAVDLALAHWLDGAPWPAADVDPLDGYEVPLGRPWMITAGNVGDDPAVLDAPGPDPVDFFRRRWQVPPGEPSGPQTRDMTRSANR